jgi:hypothetical protein
MSIGKDRPSRLDSGYLRVLLVATLLLLTCSGCSRGGNAMRVMAPATVQQLRTPPENNTLSREHTVVIDVSDATLETGFRKEVDRCMADSDHHCTVLQSDLSSGQWPAGLIKLRIDPAAVEDLVALASGLGRLESRATTVKDLAEAIQDSQTRVDRRRQILRLRSRSRRSCRPYKAISNEPRAKRLFRPSASPPMS